MMVTWRRWRLAIVAAWQPMGQDDLERAMFESDVTA